MKASIYLTPDDPVTHKPKTVRDQNGRISSELGSVVGMSLPYVTRGGFPVLLFEGEHLLEGFQSIAAIPGMVCVHGSTYELYVIDSDGEPQRLSVKTISTREYERCKLLEESQRAEAL